MSAQPPKSDKVIELYSVNTPNGLKVNVALEELIAAGSNVSYTFHPIDMGKNEQKEPWFLALNPNGRIPVIYDNKRSFPVFESAAILLYLQKHYDPHHVLGFEDANLDSEMTQWIFFQHGGLGPMQGQAGWFLSAGVAAENPTKDKFAAKRYLNETKRLFQVYEDRLAGPREYLVGPGAGKFSYADAVTFTWIRAHPYSLGFTSLAKEGYPNLAAYVARCEARPAVAKAIKGDMIEQMKAKEDYEASIAKRSAWVWEEEKGREEL